ncbi:hypothetical protein [Verrucomicrobium spinosum]|uniref:hypothetical protein n=1 Tax=Verrucomicrobium spinosum TaxID=2736 RepID=UPI000B157758|nr:hypothetical protein [Verrucomicrobium spinosum]
MSWKFSVSSFQIYETTFVTSRAGSYGHRPWHLGGRGPKGKAQAPACAHGDWGCCHDYENQKRILAEGLSSRSNVEFTIVHEGPDPKAKDARNHKVSIYEKDDWAKGYDLILHNECFGAVDDVAFVERIAKPHFDGVPASCFTAPPTATVLRRQTNGARHWARPA